MTVRPRLVASLAIAAVALGGAGAALAKRRPPPAAPAALTTTTYRLANGLEVILAPDPSVTTAVVLVWYHVGSKDEVAGKTGFAHLFEHLMFEGSRHVGEGEFDALLEAAGGWNNGTTSNDRTTFFEQAPAAQLPLMLWLEADRMAGLWSAMNQVVLDNQRDVVKNERSENYENVPYGKADFDVQQALWPIGHGNHNLTIGTTADLGAASLADVEAFWRTYYRPSNATLVIAGGIDQVATALLGRLGLPLARKHHDLAGAGDALFGEVGGGSIDGFDLVVVVVVLVVLVVVGRGQRDGAPDADDGRWIVDGELERRPRAGPRCLR